MRERGAEDDAGGRHDQGALSDCRGPASRSQRAVAPRLRLHTHTVDTTVAYRESGAHSAGAALPTLTVHSLTAD